MLSSLQHACAAPTHITWPLSVQCGRAPRTLPAGSVLPSWAHPRDQVGPCLLPGCETDPSALHCWRPCNSPAVGVKVKWRSVCSLYPLMSLGQTCSKTQPDRQGHHNSPCRQPCPHPVPCFCPGLGQAGQPAVAKHDTSWFPSVLFVLSASGVTTQGPWVRVYLGNPWKPWIEIKTGRPGTGQCCAGTAGSHSQCSTTARRHPRLYTKLRLHKAIAWHLARKALWLEWTLVSSASWLTGSHRVVPVC